jgi:hypothetical protein
VIRQSFSVVAAPQKAPGRTPDALEISMNTQTLGIPSTALSSDDHLIPAPITILPTLIERLGSSHAAVLEKWKRNFALDLRRPKIVAQRT